jgi:hypothetical protein
MRVFLRTIAVAAVLTACDIINGPETLCACDPAVIGSAVLYGEVIDPDGHLVENARVNAHLIGDAPCPAVPATLQPGQFNTTGGIGQFRYPLAWSAPVTKCFAVWASPPNGSNLSPSDTVAVVVNYTASLSDSAFVQLQLR